MKKLIKRVPPESEMTLPTLMLFPESSYHHFEQVTLGRKAIDLVCIKRKTNSTIAIELKVANWRHALWQASVNLQVVNESFIAIWHIYAHRAENSADLLRQYGVGLISVNECSAEIVMRSQDPVRRIAKSKKREWYEHLLRVDECSIT